MTRVFFRRLLAAAILPALLAACASNQPAAGAPAVEIPMDATEFGFTPAPVTLAAGTPYRFVVRNTGAVAHEWVVTPQNGGAHAHDAHADTLGAIDSAELGPGASAARELTFAAPGSYEVACHLPGHYEAGMRLTLAVQ
ncbi:MAG TPA: cupredoxin domain-containing protein [Herpetosiphonaceae bacterium]